MMLSDEHVFHNGSTSSGHGGNDDICMAARASGTINARTEGGTMRISPPTIFDLLDDPVYRAYMKRVPTAHFSLSYGQPWQVWARTEDGRWLTRKFDTYAAAWNVLVKYYRRRGEIGDIALVSRRLFYGPPGEWRKVKVKRANKTPVGQPLTFRYDIEERWYPTFAWDAGLEWCGRCRRPTTFRKLWPDHHALRRQPCLSTDDDPVRCTYCGVRRTATPDISTMEEIA